MLHSILLASAVGATAGVFIGIINGYFKRRKMQNNPAYLERAARFVNRVLKFLSNSLYVLLVLCLIWTVYFMVLGIADPTSSEYAANSSTLIVSVATIFSIIIAFYEFIKKDK